MKLIQTFANEKQSISKIAQMKVKLENLKNHHSFKPTSPLIITFSLATL